MTFEDKLKSIFPTNDNSILLAFLTILGYTSAYIFEIGYLTYFEVPIAFIQIDLNTTLRSMAIVIIFIYFFLSALGLALDLLTKAHPFWQVAGEALVMVLILIPFVYINRFTNITHAWLLVGAFLFLLVLSLVPPLFHKDIKSYWSRVTRIYPTIHNSTQTQTTGISKFGSFMLFGLGCLFFIIIVSGLGSKHAKLQSEFLALKHQPNMILVRVYGETIITKEVNLETNLIGNNIQVFKADSNPLEITTSELKYVISKADKDYIDSVNASVKK